MIIKKQTFERKYIRNSGITLRQYREWKLTVPCNCDYEGCQGWGAIPNDPDLIDTHNRLYAPHCGDEKSRHIWNGDDWIIKQNGQIV